MINVVTFSVQKFADEGYFALIDTKFWKQGRNRGTRRGCFPTVLLLNISHVTVMIPGYRALVVPTNKGVVYGTIFLTLKAKI